MLFNDTSAHVMAIEVATKFQSACLEWKEQKAGCITASNMKMVFTRAEAMLEKVDENPS